MKAYLFVSAVLVVLAVLMAASAVPAPPAGRLSDHPWARHTIDDSSQGADGTRLADVNGDGLLDITTGWEEGGRIRAYVNPGPERAKERWPSVTVGKVKKPEDAVFADLDGDGAVDVVSSTEGEERTLYVHWAPKSKDRYLDAGAWKTEALPASKDLVQWMFALPMQIDGRHGIDLVAGSKNDGAAIGWFQAPESPRDLAGWQWHSLYKAGWIMSLVPFDMDGDGDLDIVASDRKGPRRGSLWLENPGVGDGESQGHGSASQPLRSQGPASELDSSSDAQPLRSRGQAGVLVATAKWKEHRIGPVDGHEAMFLTIADLDRDWLDDVLVAVREGPIQYHRRTNWSPPRWETHTIQLPPNTGTGKAVAVGDIDLDGKLDVVFSCENAFDSKAGVMWLSYRKAPTDSVWEAHPISGPQGIKFDMVKLIDLDDDGDLDAITCEERDNLGVIWYENPAR